MVVVDMSPPGTVQEPSHCSTLVLRASPAIAKLRWAADHEVTALAVKGDSLLLVEQMRGNYKVKN